MDLISRGITNEMEVLDFLKEIQHAIPVELRNKTKKKISQLGIYLAMKPGMRKFVENTPHAKTCRGELRSLLQETFVFFSRTRPNMLDRNSYVLAMV